MDWAKVFVLVISECIWELLLQHLILKTDIRIEEKKEYEKRETKLFCIRVEWCKKSEEEKTRRLKMNDEWKCIISYVFWEYAQCFEIISMLVKTRYFFFSF